MFSIHYLKMYLVTFTTCLSIDAIWLLLIAKPFYKKHLGYFLTDNPQLLYALIFYLLFSAALLIFVIMPAIQNKSLTNALSYGFFFGLVAYSAYDLTNQATIKDWPTIVTYVDMIWGATLAALTCVISFSVNNLL